MALTELVLDPPEVAGSRVAFPINSGAIRVGEAGPDWGESAIQAYMAEMARGSAPVDFRVPNRQIAIPLTEGANGPAGFTAARSALQAKVALIQREGGWLRRDGLYCDLVNATLTHPDKWGHLGVEAEVVLALEALPDFYGDETVLDVGSEGASVLALAGLPANIAGDFPGRVGIEVVETAGAPRLGLLWAIRCRHYSPDATAAAEYVASALTPLDSAAVVAGKVTHSNLGAGWTPVLSTDLAGVGALTHTGSYRVWARVSSTSAIPPMVRLAWDVGDLIGPAENTPRQLPRSGAPYLLDLGQIRLDRAPVGEHLWQGILQAKGAVGGENVTVEALYLLNVDEGYGQLSAPVDSGYGHVSYAIRDEFNQAVGALAGQTLAVAQATAGPLLAGTGANILRAGGRESWTATGNITASDNTRASAGRVDGSSTHYLQATDFGFAIPAGSTIGGIVFDVECQDASGGTSPTKIQDLAVRVVKGGVIGTDDRKQKTNWSQWVDAVRTYGSVTDKWGLPWTVADVNAPGFGFAIAAWAVTQGGDPRVDAIRAYVYYTPPGGQQWSGAGNSADLSVEATSHTVQRTAVSDTSLDTGRYALAGTTVFTDVAAQVDFKISGSYPHANRHGVLARYVDTSNWLMAAFASTAAGFGAVQVLKRVAGVTTALFSVTDRGLAITSSGATVRLMADSEGRWFLWAFSPGSSPTLLAGGQDAALATGGPLASGKCGIYDAQTSAIARTRTFDNLAVWVPPTPDAVIYPGQTAQLRSDGCYRQGPGSAAVGRKAPAGDLPRLPPSGAEGRPVELFVLGSAGDLDRLPDTEGGDLTVQATYRPSFLNPYA